MLATVCEEFTEVSESGLHLAPKETARVYNMQLGCSVRESRSINMKHLRNPSNAALVDNIIRKLHR